MYDVSARRVSSASVVRRPKFVVSEEPAAVVKKGFMKCEEFGDVERRERIGDAWTA